MGGKKSREEAGIAESKTQGTIASIIYRLHRRGSSQITGREKSPTPRGNWACGDGDVYFRKPKASLKGGQAKKRPTRQGA